MDIRSLQEQFDIFLKRVFQNYRIFSLLKDITGKSVALISQGNITEAPFTTLYYN
jgi:hypothetical protein